MIALNKKKRAKSEQLIFDKRTCNTQQLRSRIHSSCQARNNQTNLILHDFKMSSASNKELNYNKWFIHPNIRLKRKVINQSYDKKGIR